ncbi:hypothetical protein MN116_005003 [Schistosoma mekongi]|uniref:Uncharacterized protein n=1 Tax=Schistosoma mekongi TaxID=38744 RepID=A0AAE1ZD49_SCHME|nr:hypothetical protein MN116_005003 [Schistosoma mekongi]
MKKDSHEWHPYVQQYGYYDPVAVGSIDGTDTTPHDRAVQRALTSSYRRKNKVFNWDPKATIFIGRLPYYTSKVCLQKALQKLLNGHLKTDSNNKYEKFCRNRSPFSHDEIWPKIHIVHDVITGYPCGYGFAYFSSELDAKHVLRAWCKQSTVPSRSFPRIKDERHCGLDILNGDKVILEPCFSGTLPGWRPRRLGGGLGGRKEAGQLRFGGIARPFRRPFTENVIIEGTETKYC